jgi:hypothetical protein
MPRPTKFDEPMVVLNVRLPAHHATEVDAAARRVCLGRSRFLRAAIYAAIVNSGDPEYPHYRFCRDCGEPMIPWTGQTVIRDGELGAPVSWRCEACQRTHVA